MGVAARRVRTRNKAKCRVLAEGSEILCTEFQEHFQFLVKINVIIGLFSRNYNLFLLRSEYVSRSAGDKCSLVNIAMHRNLTPIFLYSYNIAIVIYTIGI